MRGLTASRRTIAGWSIEALLASAVPLLLIPIALQSLPIAAAGALGLSMAAAAPIVGLARLGTAILAAAFAALPMDSIHAVGPLQVSDVLLAVGFACLIPKVFGTSLRLPTVYVVAAIGILITGTLSALATDDPSGNLRYLANVVLGLIILPALIAWWKPSLREVSVLAAGYMVGNFINLSVAVIEGPGPSGRSLGWSSHENVMAYGQLLALALAPFVLAIIPRQRRWLVMVSAVGSLYGIWLTGSRGALVAAIILALLYPLLSRSIPAALGLGALAIPAMWLVQRTAASADTTSALGRLLGGGSASHANAARERGAEIAMDQFLAHPALGDGWITVWGAHIAYLQIAAAIGLLGLAAYLLLLSALLRPLITLPAPYALLALPTLAAALVDMVLPLVGATAIWAVLSLALAADRLSAEAKP